MTALVTSKTKHKNNNFFKNKVGGVNYSQKKRESHKKRVKVTSKMRTICKRQLFLITSKTYVLNVTVIFKEKNTTLKRIVKEDS